MEKRKTKKKVSTSQRKRAPQWKLLERIVAMIEKSIAPDAVVRHDVKLPDKTTGDLRQCDIVIQHGAQPRQTLSIVEVQKRKRRIKISDLDSWWQKMLSVGAQHLICVSLHDFPTSVRKKVATVYGPTVRLVRLRELSDGQFPIGLSSIPFRVPNARLDATRRVEFHLEEPHDWTNDIKASGADRIFRRSNEDGLLSIADMLREIGDKHQEPLRLAPGTHRGIFELRNPSSLSIIREGQEYQITNLFIPAIVDVTQVDVPVSVSSYEQVGWENSLAWLAEATLDIDDETLGFRMTFVPVGQGRFELAQIQPTGSGRGAFLSFRGKLN